MINEIVNVILGVPSAHAYTYAAAEVTAIGTEITDMLTAYFPALLLIFAMLFALALFRKQVRIWLGK